MTLDASPTYLAIVVDDTGEAWATYYGKRANLVASIGDNAEQGERNLARLVDEVTEEEA